MNNKSPVPSKIKDYFAIEIQHDDFAVKGRLICSCGADSFKIFYFGKKGSFLSPTINKQKTENGRRIAIRAECNECHKVISIYDYLVDGLKNIHSARELQPISYSEFACEKCGTKGIHVEIAYNSLGEKELTSKGIENWKDYFSMILVSTKCNVCGKSHDGFLEEG